MNADKPRLSRGRSVGRGAHAIWSKDNDLQGRIQDFMKIRGCFA